MLEGKKIIDKMLAISKDICRFVSSSQISRAVTPVIKGDFYCPLNKDATSWGVSETASEALLKDLTPGKVASLICHHDETYRIMSKTLAPSESSPQPCPARSIINNLLLADNLDELRHRLSRDYLQLITGEPDYLERERMFSDFNTLDMILETIERERK